MKIIFCIFDDLNTEQNTPQIGGAIFRLTIRGFSWQLLLSLLLLLPLSYFCSEAMAQAPLCLDIDSRKGNEGNNYIISCIFAQEPPFLRTLTENLALNLRWVFLRFDFIWFYMISYLFQIQLNTSFRFSPSLFSFLGGCGPVAVRAHWCKDLS